MHTGAVQASEKLTAKMNKLRSTWADTKKQWEASASTAASAADTVHTGLESAYRELRTPCSKRRTSWLPPTPSCSHGTYGPPGPGAGLRFGVPVRLVVGSPEDGVCPVRISTPPGCAVTTLGRRRKAVYDTAGASGTGWGFAALAMTITLDGSSQVRVWYHCASWRLQPKGAKVPSATAERQLL